MPVKIMFIFIPTKIACMNDKIKVCLVQPQMIWEDVDANLEMLDGMIGAVDPGTDLILLPETFSTGFTMHSDRYAEQVDGKAVSWMLGTAREKRTHITGSLIIREEGRIYNRLYWISPEGIEGYYDKRHLFRMGREDENFTPGEARRVFRLGPFRFLPQVCYDLRFPVFSRNRGDYDILFYVANWPAHRQPVWDILTRARAMENQAYVLGINRVGTDGEGVAHLGGTCLIDPAGNEICRMGDMPGIQTFTLDLKTVREFREKFPAWKDADQFTID